MRRTFQGEKNMNVCSWVPQRKGFAHRPRNNCNMATGSQTLMDLSTAALLFPPIVFDTQTSVPNTGLLLRHSTARLLNFFVLHHLT